MKLSTKLASGSGLFGTLADESDRVTTLEVLGLPSAAQVQVSPLVRGASPAIHPRTNVQTSPSVVATITYASRAAALASVETFSTFYGDKYHLAIQQDATVLYYPNASLLSYTPTFSGLTVRHQMQWTAQALQTTEP